MNEELPGYLPGVVEAMAALKAAGYLLVGIHHLPGEVPGVMDYVKKMLMKDLKVDFVASCGHGDWEGCICRKPNPFLLNELIRIQKIDVVNSHFVGASYEDISMGRAAGITNVYFVIPNTPGFFDITEKRILCKHLSR